MIISESLNQYKGQFESLIEVNNLQQNQIEELINENININ
jgi:response regulator of citrate/malate metabolism